MALIVCDGDSVVAGVGGVNSYVATIAADCSTFSTVTPTVINDGVSGQTSFRMLYGAAGGPAAPGADGLAAQVLAAAPDVVCAQFATLNDIGWQQATGATDAQLVAVWRAYMDMVNAQTAPNGSPTPLVILCDNFCGQNLATAYPRPWAAQDHMHTLWRQTVGEYANNPYVTPIDPYPYFRRYGTDTPALFSALQPDLVHPNAGGYTAFRYPVQYVLANLIYAASHGVYDASVPNPPPLRPTTMTVKTSALRLAEGEYDTDDGSTQAVSLPAAF